jgi:hypothetical protein
MFWECRRWLGHEVVDGNMCSNVGVIRENRVMFIVSVQLVGLNLSSLLIFFLNVSFVLQRLMYLPSLTY